MDNNTIIAIDVKGNSTHDFLLKQSDLLENLAEKYMASLPAYRCETIKDVGSENSHNSEHNLGIESNLELIPCWAQSCLHSQQRS